MKRSSKDGGYYTAQYARTTANKARLAKRRAAKREYWKTRPHSIALSRRAKWRGRLFGFHPQQIAVTDIKLPDPATT